MKLASKVALITGGAQGLGKAIALAMAREGASIVICDINPKTLPDAEAEIQCRGRLPCPDGRGRRLPVSRPMVWHLPVHRDRFCFGPFRLRFRGVSPQPFRFRQGFR